MCNLAHVTMVDTMLVCFRVRRPPSPSALQVRRLTQHLNALRGEIDAEKGLQERILREFRQQVGSGRSRKGRY